MSSDMIFRYLPSWLSLFVLFISSDAIKREKMIWVFLLSLVLLKTTRNLWCCQKMNSCPNKVRSYKSETFFRKADGDKWFQNHIMEKERMLCLQLSPKVKKNLTLNGQKEQMHIKTWKKIVRDDILTIVPSTFCDPSLKPIKGRFLLRFLLTRAFYSNWFHFFPSTYHNIALLQLSIIPSRNPLCIKFLSWFVCIGLRVVSGSKHYCTDDITE